IGNADWPDVRGSVVRLIARAVTSGVYEYKPEVRLEGVHVTKAIPELAVECIAVLKNERWTSALDIVVDTNPSIGDVRHRICPLSALPPKADMCSALAHVRFGPKADIDAGSASVGRDAVVYLYAWRDLDQSIILRSLYSSTRSAFPLNL